MYSYSMALNHQTKDHRTPLKPRVAECGWLPFFRLWTRAKNVYRAAAPLTRNCLAIGCEVWVVGVWGNCGEGGSG